MRHHRYGVTPGCRRPRTNGETAMHALIVWAVVNGLESVSKLSSGRRLFMGLEGRLILPDFNDHEAVRPAGLLDDIDAQISPLCAAGFAVLPDQRDALTRGVRLDVDVRRDMEHCVAGLGRRARRKQNRQEQDGHIRVSYAETVRRGKGPA